MLLYLVVGFRTCCLAAVLLLVTLSAGEPPHPLLGATRDQLLNRFGEPRSQLSSGGREVWFYPRERLVLSNGVVVEVERIAADAPARVPPPASAPADPVPTPPSATSPAPAAGAGPSGSRESSARPADSTAATTPTPSSVEPKLEIKLVRPPSATPPFPVDPVPPQASQNPVVSPSVPLENAPPPTASAPVVNVPEAALNSVDAAARPPVAASKPGPVSNPSSTVVAAEPVRDTAPSPSPAPAPSTSVPATASGLFGTGMWIIAGTLVLGVIGLLIWRYRQKQMEFAATSVENTPLASTLAANGRFTPEFLSQLDSDRFEALVAEYYSKTGVIAMRTHASTGSPVQIKISWKGESRPFALVHCISQPSAPVDAKPLQELITALKTEGIRRGYVVTSGNFIPAARMFAEESHLTLLSGDGLAEKLNALPDSARSELAQVIALHAPKASR